MFIRALAFVNSREILETCFLLSLFDPTYFLGYSNNPIFIMSNIMSNNHVKYLLLTDSYLSLVYTVLFWFAFNTIFF